MKSTMWAISLAAGLTVGSAVPARALDPAPPDAGANAVSHQDDSGPSLLGPPFEDQSAGISLRIPFGCHRARSTGVGDDIGQFGDEKREWQLKITRMTREQPTFLAESTDNFGKPVVGLLDQTVAGLKKELSGCVILRQDLINIRDGSQPAKDDPHLKDNVAMIAVRYTATGHHYLTQQAIIQSTDRLFYLIALTTPASEATGDAADNDPAERIAVDTFRQMLDSVRLLDTVQIHEDQVERLFRTRALMVNWTPARVHSVLIGEQWLRIVRDGKDVGYSYITEQTAGGVPRPLTLDEVKAGKSDRDLVQPGDGVLIGVRARMLDPVRDVTPDEKPKGPVQIDSASWLFVTADRKLEDWSRVLVVDDGSVGKDGKPVKNQIEEFGSSNSQTIRSLDKDRLPGTAIDKNQPAIKVREQYTLDVTTVSQSSQGEPVNRDLPPWYLPQALGQLLPRLVPLHPELDFNGTPKPRKYLFATYVPEIREVMHRYIDVGDEQMVNFAGKTIQAIPITDRLGWHGPITTHYMSPTGEYLGSENKESHLLMLPTDSASLMDVWKNANLTRPGAVERPVRGMSPGASNSIDPQPAAPAN